jgi:hypothetical protein
MPHHVISHTGNLDSETDMTRVLAFPAPHCAIADTH